MSNDGDKYPRAGMVPVRVRLSCGHVIKLRLDPMNDRAVFGCTHGKGCGYRLHWNEVWQIETPHVVHANPLYPPPEKETTK